jgi:hypothetical protein
VLKGHFAQSILGFTILIVTELLALFASEIAWQRWDRQDARASISGKNRPSAKSWMCMFMPTSTLVIVSASWCLFPSMNGFLYGLSFAVVVSGGISWQLWKELKERTR